MIEKKENKLVFSFEDLTLKAGQKLLFQNLNLQVRKGDHLLLTGSSGSGKTTLLKALAGKSNISEGKIVRHFYEDYKAHHRIEDPLFNFSSLIATVPERARFKNASNTTDLYYQQRYNSMDADDAPTVQEYLDDIYSKRLTQDKEWDVLKVQSLLNLTHLVDKQVIKLSNGETKRLLIAAALVKNPLLLLFDNPLEGLDVQTRAGFDNILEAIVNSGITTVMTGSANHIPSVISHVGILEGPHLRKVPAPGFDPATYGQRKESSFQKAFDRDLLHQLVTDPSPQRYAFIIRLKDVSIKYGDRTILKNINWDVRQGEHWILSGPNGSGKTTLLSLVNGDNPQVYANDVILFDRKRGSGESIWEIKKKIGFVSPELHQYFPENISCIQVIESGFYDTQGLFKKSDPEKKAVALKWMEVFDLTGLADKPFRDASSSHQRVLLLARALVKNPPLLILDEPCQGLDIEQQKHFRQIVEELCKVNDATVLYVTHHREEIPSGFELEYQLSPNPATEDGA